MYFSTIQKVKESKKLGIYFDKKLEFEYHVENFVGKLWQILGLYRNWNSSPLAWKINFVVPVFLSVLDYKDFKYWHAAESPLRPVDLIKKTLPLGSPLVIVTTFTTAFYMVKLFGLTCLREIPTGTDTTLFENCHLISNICCFGTPSPYLTRSSDLV